MWEVLSNVCKYRVANPERKAVQLTVGVSGGHEALPEKKKWGAGRTFIFLLWSFPQLIKVVSVLSSCSQRTEWDLGVDNLPGRIFTVRRHRQAGWHSTA